MEIEEGLEGMRQDATVVEGRGRHGPRCGELLRGLLWEVPEVAPGTRRIEDNLRVVGEVELEMN